MDSNVKTVLRTMKNKYNVKTKIIRKKNMLLRKRRKEKKGILNQNDKKKYKTETFVI